MAAFQRVSEKRTIPVSRVPISNAPVRAPMVGLGGPAYTSPAPAALSLTGKPLSEKEVKTTPVYIIPATPTPTVVGLGGPAYTSPAPAPTPAPTPVPTPAAGDQEAAGTVNPAGQSDFTALVNFARTLLTPSAAPVTSAPTPPVSYVTSEAPPASSAMLPLLLLAAGGGLLFYYYYTSRRTE